MPCPVGLNFKLQDYYEDANKDAVYATSNGVFVPNAYEAQRVGTDGPLLVQDHHLIDLTAAFDRERIPERVVHAKGAGAHGTFTCTKSLEDICLAEIFGKEGQTCPITMRFSTVGGESGSADTARDPRGFSVKFRTEQGNMDWVFNNTPIFFLRDPAKFFRFIHTQKRCPQTHLTHMENPTQFWDYLSQNPESVHQVMILFGDRGVPSSYRKMQGYSGHTFKMVAKDGSWKYVQIHCRSEQGVDFLTQDKAVELAGSTPNYATKDLFEAIDRKEFPRWKCYVQVMTPEQAEKYKYNVFDLTKVWPHADFPLREFGMLELNQNVANYFAEIEQVAFSPSHLVPGIEPSADPVLQSRLFSYPDTHRHRLGVNYQHLPVNQHCNRKAGNFSRDGPAAFYNQGSRPNYLSSIQPIEFHEREVDINKVHNHFTGGAVAALSELMPIDFEQPRALWEKVMDKDARERFCKNVSGHMEKMPEKNKYIIERQLAIFHEVSPEIASGIAKELGIKSYPQGIKGMKFNGIRNTVYDPKQVNEHGYANGHANGHPSENANLDKHQSIANGI